MSLTKDTLIAFLIVVTLAGAALGLADETEAALKPEDMAKLGIHRMPNGEWMQVAKPAAADKAAPSGADHSGHIADPDAGPGQNVPGDSPNPPGTEAPQQTDHEMPDGQMMDHEMMGH